jgi:hypothetical protein
LRAIAKYRITAIQLFGRKSYVYAIVIIGNYTILKTFVFLLVFRKEEKQKL